MSHKWKFFCAGGFDQVKLDSGADLARLGELDQKLWVALACPTRGLEFDSRTLDLIDTDKDGRVRAPEVIAAAKWATDRLKNPDDLLKASPSLPLAAINDAVPEGKEILSSARQILANLGKKDETAISLEEVSDTAKIFAATNFNGDGIIPADAAEDEAVKSVMADIMACLGIETDRSGKPGISQAKADQFFAEAEAYSNWWRQAEGDKNILPLSEATAAAAAAVQTVKAKVDDFFARCRLAAFDARAVAALNRPESEYAALAAKNLTVDAPEIAGFPLAQIAAGRALPLVAGVNPAWAGALATLQTAAVQPLLGARNELTEADWEAVQGRLAAFDAWATGKQGAAVEKLGLHRVREILAGGARAKINALIAQDKALEPEANAIAAVEKLIRFHRDLYTLCVNFVNFQNFYSRKTPAIFQAGRLFLDQRSCDLCLTVEDPAKHATMAGLAGAYLAYLDCVRLATGEKLSILAVVSQGDDDNLMVGRNGIFYDRKGRDYDATITRIVANPISMRQAFWLPYKKLVRLVEEQISKRAAAANDDVNANLTAAASMSGSTAAGASKPAFDPSVIALLSVAVGSLAAAAAGIATFLGKFAAWQLPIVFGGIMLIISGPSLILAYINLRKRNLGPILDANGWAVNARAKVNVPLGTSLTEMARLPKGSSVDVSDRYAEKPAAWPKILAVLFVIWWIYAFMDDMGILWRLTKNWDTPLGKPPASMTAKSSGATNAVTIAATTTNAPAAK